MKKSKLNPNPTFVLFEQLSFDHEEECACSKKKKCCKKHERKGKHCKKCPQL